MVRASLSDISLATQADRAALEARWRALQGRADGSFFQSWSWVGCLVEQRFPRPALLEATENGVPVALALFNRHPTRLARNTLWLNETGDPGRDTIFVEHNGVLIARGATAEVLPACLLIMRRLASRVVLSGVDAALVEAAGRAGYVRPRRWPQAAPAVDLRRLRREADGHFAALSANTRQQLRRALRRYAARGPLAVDRATTCAEAFAFLDALASLHQQSWTRRGQPGAFAAPWFRQFHRELITRGLPNGEIDLLRVRAGDDAIGYLYNFCFAGRISAYQSGFAYEAGDAQLRPGLVCHHLAITRAIAEGLDTYDFLAGEDRYKTSLANDGQVLHWVEMLAPGTPAWLATRAVDALKAARGRPGAYCPAAPSRAIASAIGA